MSKESYEFAEGSRGVLVTACRRMRLLDCRPSSFDSSKFRDAGFGTVETKWLNWIDNEKGKRLGLSVYMYDCQYPALFNNQHFVSKAETTNCVFPCDEPLWESPSAESWKSLLGAAELPKAEYVQRFSILAKANTFQILDGRSQLLSPKKIHQTYPRNR